ncbi:BAG family molecular chaperone regulator 2 isoform X1 [Maniola jurtina]|uniref:BAG family molecular chaperone regulator 2 isoform X1 n=1 Tax=Maniola jurtina TaxID=191418 RepID=UPI001E68C837|nr:BAG family molecular chaperone regulator 2 isoform X1 [Maniola jurtina]
MEVDVYTIPETSRLPLIDETSALGTTAPKDRLIAVLDQVEMRVERLRRDTVRIEEERDSLLSTLDSVKHSELLAEITECDKDDITRYADRILARAMTVEVAVRTDRDPQQEEALHQVNLLIDQLVVSVHEDTVIAHTRCQTYMNACTSQPDYSSGTDRNFETAILGCTLDDQKRVKKRLQGLLDYIAKMNVTTCS